MRNTTDRLARLEALLHRPRMNDPKRIAWQRLLLALRALLTSNGADYIPAIAALRERMKGHRLTTADRAALAKLRTADLATVGATAADVVNVVHEALSDF